ncbi:hypothetical protein [Alteraurantiacibacter palmitatis]|uniref:ABC transporter permease n=1 Tax=Alteraurantiacibacter palmitatis TaxID=2054628 RepID=A0ABV7E7N3_9SPHN
MSKAIALTRLYAADPVDALRSAIVLVCAAALILAGAALPF